MGVGKDFTTWIKGRISKYDFVENEDYKLDSPKRVNQNSHGGDRKTKVYSLTLDMAKELSMVENNKNYLYQGYVKIIEAFPALGVDFQLWITF